jgi:hypothetical protein
VRLCLALSRPNDRYPQVVEDLDKGREEEPENNRSSVSKGATHPAILAKGNKHMEGGTTNRVQACGAIASTDTLPDEHR